MNTSLTVMSSVEQCVTCPEGTFCSIGVEVPTPCAPGTFNPTTNASTCTLCPAGLYQGTSGSTECLLCEPGSYCPLGSPTSLPCPAGTYGASPGLQSVVQCALCELGSFCGIGSATPTPCGPGTKADQLGQSNCTLCDTGTFSNTRGASACTPCTPGHWCTSEAQIACSENTYNPEPRSGKQTDCLRCPERTNTLELDARTSEDDCSCNQGYYYAPANFTVGRDECVARCCTCPVGTGCDYGSITLAALPVSPGFFRLSNDSVDVRRCPDAATNCSALSECSWTSSGCAGGRSEDLCHPGLTGAFCRSCIEPYYFYKRATEDNVAHCESCSSVSTSGPVVVLIISACTLLTGFICMCMVRAGPRWRREQLLNIWLTVTNVYGVPNKLKIVVGFYQIVTRIETVYAILLPAEVRELLLQLQLTISLGIDGIPLACVGAAGYKNRLVFWMLAPLLVVILTMAIGVSREQFVQHFRASRSQLLNSTAPAVLRIFFLAYPIVTNVAFEAFSCFWFENGDGFLATDVSIVCGTDEHHESKLIATFAILIYPVGLLILNGSLLAASRNAIVCQQPTSLSHATAFLHREYKPQAYLWELVEMTRRLLLVGAFVVGPYHPGSLMQLAVATVTCVLFFAFQLQLMPYLSHTDNLLANGCSLSLIVIFVTSIFYKVAALTELKEIQDRMSYEQQEDFVMPTAPLTAVLILSVLGALILLGVVVAQVAAKQALDRALARRLHHLETRKEVVIPPLKRLEKQVSALYGKNIDPNDVPSRGPFHIFLSHNWKHGQAKMRIIKTRLREMLGTRVSIFLDVDNLGGGADHNHIDVSDAVLCYCTEKWWTNQPCIREVVRGILRKKKIITLLEPDTTDQHGGFDEAACRKILRGELCLKGPGGMITFEERLQQQQASVDKWAVDWGEPGLKLPTVAEIEQKLFESAPIMWFPLADFQDVTMRLIAEQLLLESQHPYGGPYEQKMYVSGEIEQRLKKKLMSTPPALDAFSQPSSITAQLRLSRATRVSSTARFHFYCSAHTPHAREVVHELNVLLGWDLSWTEELHELKECQHMLIHLRYDTWSRGEESLAFANEVCEAMRLGVHRQLVHEVAGARLEEEARDGCTFDDLIASTPEKVLAAGIYNEIAMNLAGGEWRNAGLIGLAKQILKEGGRSERWRVEPQEPNEADVEKMRRRSLQTQAKSLSRVFTMSRFFTTLGSAPLDEAVRERSRGSRRSGHAPEPSVERPPTTRQRTARQATACNNRGPAADVGLPDAFHLSRPRAAGDHNSRMISESFVSEEQPRRSQTVDASPAAQRLSTARPPLSTRLHTAQSRPPQPFAASLSPDERRSSQRESRTSTTLPCSSHLPAPSQRTSQLRPLTARERLRAEERGGGATDVSETSDAARESERPSRRSVPQVRRPSHAWTAPAAQRHGPSKSTVRRSVQSGSQTSRRSPGDRSSPTSRASTGRTLYV